MLQTARILWVASTSSQVVILIFGVVIIGGVADPAALDTQALWPTFAPGTEAQGALWYVAFGMLGSSFMVPKLLEKQASSVGRAAHPLTPFLVSIALAEACTVLSFVAAGFMGPPVPELMIVPVFCAVCVSLARFPTAQRFS